MAATTSAHAGRLPELAKYDVIEEIGHGGMATVYRAHDPRLSRDVAVKVIHPHLRDSVEAKARFVSEAKAVAKLRHPNIVEVFDVSTEGDREQYLVAELVRGPTLRKLLRDRGVLPPEIAAAIALELLAALGHAHAGGVVHRDVKPENVMLERRAEEGAAPSAEHVAVKLTDFGIAKLLDAQGVTSTGQVLGSPAHMAPEQIEGGNVDARADLFGLGVLFYECVVGHLPFEGNNPAQVLRRVLEGIYPPADAEQPTVGKTWSTILDRALARTPEERFASTGEMKSAITREFESLGIASPRAELDAWLADPAAYASSHDAARIAKLCELGRAARAKGDAIDAAARFNRALAYAPHDPELLRVVASVHREGAWRAGVRRAVPIALVSAALGAGAYFVTRAVRGHRAERAELTAPSASAASSAEPAATDSPLASAPVGPATARPPSIAPILARPIVVPPPKAIARAVTLEAVQPPFGVLVAIDGTAAGEATSGRVLTVDAKAHALTFTCVEDQCVPQTKNVLAGEDPDVSLSVRLDLRPASVIVDGDPSLSYGLLDHPEIAIRIGVPSNVPVTHKTGAYVIERPSGRKLFAWLNPGKETMFNFLAEPNH